MNALTCFMLIVILISGLVSRVNSEVCSDTSVKYVVDIHTGDKWLAGTDADVFIQFIGPKGTTAKLPLGGSFERDDRDTSE
ncbi:uncharacterized protein LOC121371430 isoform X3 [Gigantopelta aegis]|uniref:uncharacterized protein LOC121371430 isoform X3 n=1 Tax=Gigantopelta aegis TaxID=1735272 RepID=UPI001B888874|nr:uncharacterized protein LOC121371430 isoform X3 [Gigantopelta aegis]